MRPTAEGGPLEVFQFTTAITHPIDFETVVAMNQKAAEKTLFKKNDSITAIPTSLLFSFVVPEEKFPMWKNEQSYVTKTVDIELKHSETSECWQFQFCGGILLIKPNPKPNPDVPQIALTSSGMLITYKNASFQLDQIKNENCAVKVGNVSFHLKCYVFEKQRTLTKLPQELKDQLIGVKQRVISLKDISRCMTMQKNHFSTLAAGHRLVRTPKLSSPFMLPRVSLIIRRLI